MKSAAKIERYEKALREIGLPKHLPEHFDALEWWRHMACVRGEIARDALGVTASVNPVATELHAEFPLLWEQAQAFDFAERLGGCSDPLLAEIDQAMRELWLARTNLRETA